ELLRHDKMLSNVYKIKSILNGLYPETKYIKDYMKSIKGKLEKQRPERFKNYQLCFGENMNPDGVVALLDYHVDGVTPYMMFFRDGLEMKK
ncbi:Translationally-controlled tumor protein, partial [Galemys pyrenaicus]